MKKFSTNTAMGTILGFQLVDLGSFLKMRKDGKIVRGKYQSLKLRELSAVTIPAQSGALMTVMKNGEPMRALTEIVKYYSDDQEAGYRTFAELLSDNERRARYWEAQEEIYPLITAVTDSIRSVIADEQIEWATKESLLRETVEAFLESISSKGPEIEAELVKMLTEGANEMATEIEKKLETAETELAKAQELITKMKGDKDKADADMAAMTEEKDELKKSVELAKSADDEILKVGETEIKKSAVGADVFAVLKAQEDRAVTAELSKVADAEYGNLPGTSMEKAAVLKAAMSFNEATAATFTGLLKAANEALEPAFKSIGSRGGQLSVVTDTKKAAEDYQGKVNEFVKSGMSNQDAFKKVRVDHPELFKAMQDADQAA